MKKVAIISYYHTESSLCLAKNIANNGISVDYYFFRLLPTDTGRVPGIEYQRAKRVLGVHHLTPEEIPEMISYMNKSNVNFYTVGTLGESRRYRFVSWLIMKITFFFVKQKNYDAINIVGQAPPVERIHNTFKHCNLIHTIHEVGSHQDGISTTSLINAIIKDKSKVIFHSESTLQRFLNITGSNNNPVRVIPFGKFETNLLYEKDVDLGIDIPKGQIVFLCFGRIKPYKGLDLLLEAVNELEKTHPRFTLIIAGSGNDPSLESFNKKENCIIFNRHLSNNEMMKLNRLASAVLMPYHSASQTGIAPTAFLLGNPIVATSVGALPEVIVDHKNGLLVEKDNAIAFANAMKQLIDNPNLVQRLREGATQFGCKDKYDWTCIAQETLEFYFS